MSAPDLPEDVLKHKFLRALTLSGFPRKSNPNLGLWVLLTETTLVFNMRGLMWLLLIAREVWVLVSIESKYDQAFCHLYDVLHKQEDVCVLGSSTAGD